MAYVLELPFGLPLWHGIMALPFIAILTKRPEPPAGLLHFGGAQGGRGGIDMLAFGAATAVGVASISRIGWQVDFLLFARLTHSHPGPVVCACFNALVAVPLMEMNVLRALDLVPTLFPKVAIA
jgi:hypothetical protein